MRKPPVETQLVNAVLIERSKIRAGKQPREYFDPAQMEELAASIKEHGILQPLLVRYEPSRYDGTPYVLTAGERRFRASDGIVDLLPCIIQNPSKSNPQVLTLIENLQRADLTALEEANGLKELIASQNISNLKAAKLLGKTPGWVNNRLALLKTKPDVQAVAARQPLTMSSLLLINEVKDSQTRAELLEEVENGATHSQIKSRIEALTPQKNNSSAPDKETQGRAKAFESNGTPNVSRGKRVSGNTPAQAFQTVSESITEAERKADTIEHWFGLLTDSKRAKVIPRLKQLSEKFGRLAE